MIDVTNKEPSRLWPYLKTVAKAVKIPGTELTVGSLADLQDQLSADEAQKKTRRRWRRCSQTSARWSSSSARPAPASPRTTSTPPPRSSAYLRNVASQYLYSDFKGIEQLEKLVPLKLDDVFVNLKVRRERSSVERVERESRLCRAAMGAESCGPCQGRRDRDGDRLNMGWVGWRSK